jgi:hypothetical protein
MVVKAKILNRGGHRGTPVNPRKEPPLARADRYFSEKRRSV